VSDLAAAVVAQIAETAITERLGAPDPHAIISATQTRTGVLLHINSGRNALAAEAALARAGYAVGPEPPPPNGYGPRMRVTRPNSRAPGDPPTHSPSPGSDEPGWASPGMK
jgi:hypothetical protein